MKWLDNNPLGIALGVVCAILVLVAVALAWVWSRPASSGADGIQQAQLDSSEQSQQVNELGPIGEFREVTNRPVFDESRRPVVSIEGEGLDAMSEGETEVANAPKVRLTGVVITPLMKMVTLRPESNGETVIAHEGVPLEGEYSGWIVSEINPRQITLASLRGESMSLDLLVNDREIKEPPKPEPSDSESVLAAAAEAADAEDQPMTRAEEIRQRIAERREELRRQAEQDKTEADGAQGARNNNRNSQYQSAIRNMINPKKDNEDNEDKQDDSGGN